jgi:cytosine/adenosine deaminase-related metal-dependent hydrolase
MVELWSGARAVLASAERWIPRGALVVDRGRIAAVVEAARARRLARAGMRTVDVGGALLAPGFVNAHAHLELGGLRGRIARGSDFGRWVREVVRLRAASSPRELEAAALAGAALCLESGTTTVGDVDSTGAAERALARSALRSVVYREALDAFDPSRTAAAARALGRPIARSARARIGYSPHATFSASPALLAAVARAARRRRAPIAVHWSETEAEVAWLADGSGPLARLLGPSPRRAGLELIEAAGLLRAPLALVHGNHPGAGEPARIARAGAAVVHCPGSHAWFRRAPFPLETYLRAGVRVALGTDSLASNDSLDLRREMRLFRMRHPALDATALFDMATRGGAFALGMPGEVGELAAGAWADVVLYRSRASRRAEALEELVRGEAPIRGVAIAGRLVLGEMRGSGRRANVSRSRALEDPPARA